MNVLMDLLYMIGHGICHQKPDSTFCLDGLYMPLCARCTGIYLGMAVAVFYVLFRGRFRSGRFIAPWMILLFLALLFFMGIDVITGTPMFGGILMFREADFASRLVTGMLSGLSLFVLVLPAFNHLWRNEPDEKMAPLANGKDALGLMAAASLVFLLNIHPFSQVLFVFSSLLTIFMLIGAYTILNATILRAIILAVPALERRIPRGALFTAGFLLGAGELALLSWQRVLLGV